MALTVAKISRHSQAPPLDGRTTAGTVVAHGDNAVGGVMVVMVARADMCKHPENHAEWQLIVQIPRHIMRFVYNLFGCWRT